MTATTPLPCPFCGQELALISEIELRDYPGIWRQCGPDTWAIRVPADGCPHCSHVLIDRPAKMAAWNRRVPAWGPPRPMAEAPIDGRWILVTFRNNELIPSHARYGSDGWVIENEGFDGDDEGDLAGWWPLPETRG